MTKPLFTQRLSVGVTPEMDRYLEDLARTRTRKGKPLSKADLIREAIRYYMDNQEDLSGSRRQLARSLDAKLERVATGLAAVETQLQILKGEVKTHNGFISTMKQAMQPFLDWIESRRIAKQKA